MKSNANYSLFTKGSGSSFVALLVYVDDIIITGPNSLIIDSLKSFLHSKFKLKDLGCLKYFIGLEIAKYARGIIFSQRRFLCCKLVNTPMDPKQ